MGCYVVSTLNRLRRYFVIFTYDFCRLAYQSIGAIYGDIGTSPLYVFSATFVEPPKIDELIGVLSMIIWALLLVATVKYVGIVLCANDHGEGGSFALLSLLRRHASLL